MAGTWQVRRGAVIPGRGKAASPECQGSYPDYTAILRWAIGAPAVRLSAASMMALASMP